MGRRIAAVVAALFACLVWTSAARAQTPVAGDFQKVTLDDNTQNPMELDVAPDGRVFYIERDGRLMVWKPDTQQTVQAGKVPVTHLAGERPARARSSRPTSRSRSGSTSSTPSCRTTRSRRSSRASRWSATRSTSSSEQKVLTFNHQTAQCCHSSGSLYFGPDGSLYISTGDNTNPFDSDGYNPIDEQTGREYWDAQRTSANTNDLNGKILRIKPMEIPTGAPGVGTTYSIPAGNLFDEAADTTNKTRPEIFGMGFRNPFRFTVDQTTGWVLSADYGPDAGTTNANRGPQGSVEYNVLTKSGNYGWPYCIRENVAVQRLRLRHQDLGREVRLRRAGQQLQEQHRPDQPPAGAAARRAWMGFGDTDAALPPGPRHRRRPDGRPALPLRPTLDSDRKFPAFYDNKWFIAEWNNGWIKTANLDANGAMTKVDPFALGTGYKRPMDLDFGPDGALYVIEWGSGFGGDNADSGVYRIDYVAGDKAPIADATALGDQRPRAAGRARSTAPAPATRRAARSPTRGTSTATATSTRPTANPSYTYTTNGAYTAKLTVKDQTGLTAVENILISVGNRAPTVTLETPLNGKLASFTDKIPYKVIGHRSRGRHDRRRHRLRQHRGQDLARP